MKYYIFKTFRTSYYFPKKTKENKFLYDIYNPYGNILIRLYWKLFKSSKIFRSIFRVDINNQNFPYQNIISLCPKNSQLSFNLGTPGEEQKISMLGYIPESGNNFFAKYSTKERAKVLSRNEIFILKRLNENDISPKFLFSKDSNKEVFFMTSCVKGNPYQSFDLTNNLLKAIIDIGKIDIKYDNGLIKSLSHGDLCPWNIIVDNNNDIKIIDWEMSSDRPLGYDLFTFIIHAPLIIGKNIDYITKSISDNLKNIETYFNHFNISNYYQYIISYINLRKEIEAEKGNTKLHEQYKKLAHIILNSSIISQ